MNITSYIELSLTLLQAALSAAKVGGMAPELLTDIEAALANLQAVQGTPVTWEQLQSLRVNPTF